MTVKAWGANGIRLRTTADSYLKFWEECKSMTEVFYHFHGKTFVAEEIKGIGDFRQIAKKTYGKNVASEDASGRLGIAPAFEIHESENSILHVFYKGDFPEPQIPKNCKRLNFEEFESKLQEAK